MVLCRTFQQSDVSTKRRTIEDTVQHSFPAEPETNAAVHQPKQSIDLSDAHTVGMEVPCAQSSKSKQPSISIACELKQDISDSASKASSKRSRSNAAAYADFEYSTVSEHTFDEILYGRDL